MNSKNKKLLITENDIDYIKKLYGLIKEVDEPEYDYSFDEKITFPAGYYSDKYMERDILDSKLDDIISKIAKNKYVDDEGTQVLMGPEYQNSLVIITSSGESQIPNKDNEKGGTDLNPGDLGKLRSNTINTYVRDYITSRLGDVTNLQITTDIVEPVIGETSAPDLTYYQGLVDCGLAKFKNFSKKGPCQQSTLDLKKKYDSEQFVKIFVGLKTTKNYQPINMPGKRGLIPTRDYGVTFPEIERCYTNMKIEVNYTQGKHKCNSAVYEIYLNGVKLTRNDGQPFASLNNAGLLDNAGFKYKNAGGGKFWIESNEPGGKRFNTFIVSSKMAENIVKELKETGTPIKDNFQLEFVCRNVAEFVKIDDLKGPLAFDSQNRLLNTSIKWDGKEWVDKLWGNGCHGREGGEGGVGEITIINGNGGVQKFLKATPIGKNQRIQVLVTDPCKGEQGERIKNES